MTNDNQSQQSTTKESSHLMRVEQLVGELAELLRGRGHVITTAESCTGGLIAAAITDMAGSSEWFERGFVTYSNEAKQELLGVPPGIFSEHGAVSEACVRSMAEGALSQAGADVAVSVSGIAGPGGATPGKPVGTVWIGWKMRSGASTDACEYQFTGDRRSVREQAVLEALRGTISRVNAAG